MGLLTRKNASTDQDVEAVAQVHSQLAGIDAELIGLRGGLAAINALPSVSFGDIEEIGQRIERANILRAQIAAAQSQRTQIEQAAADVLAPKALDDYRQLRQTEYDAQAQVTALTPKWQAIQREMDAARSAVRAAGNDINHFKDQLPLFVKARLTPPQWAEIDHRFDQINDEDLYNIRQKAAGLPTTLDVAREERNALMARAALTPRSEANDLLGGLVTAASNWPPARAIKELFDKSPTPQEMIASNQLEARKD